MGAQTDRSCLYGHLKDCTIGVGSQKTFFVDVLSPLRGPDRNAGYASLKALRGGTQLLRYLDYLIYQEVEAVALHGLGVP